MHPFQTILIPSDTDYSLCYYSFQNNFSYDIHRNHIIGRVFYSFHSSQLTIIPILPPDIHSNPAAIWRSRVALHQRNRVYGYETKSRIDTTDTVPRNPSSAIAANDINNPDLSAEYISAEYISAWYTLGSTTLLQLSGQHSAQRITISIDPSLPIETDLRIDIRLRIGFTHWKHRAVLFGIPLNLGFAVFRKVGRIRITLNRRYIEVRLSSSELLIGALKQCVTYRRRRLYRCGNLIIYFACLQLLSMLLPCCLCFSCCPCSCFCFPCSCCPSCSSSCCPCFCCLCSFLTVCKNIRAIIY